jgi:hypothetical protein
MFACRDENNLDRHQFLPAGGASYYDEATRPGIARADQHSTDIA